MENTNEKRRYQVTEIQLTYKSGVKPSLRPKISGSKVQGIFEVSTGGVSETVADPKIIFAAAIKANSSGIIVAHNHPSGNLRVSQTLISHES